MLHGMFTTSREERWTFELIQQCAHTAYFYLRFKSPASCQCYPYLRPEPNSPSEALWLHLFSFIGFRSSSLAVPFAPGKVNNYKMPAFDTYFLSKKSIPWC